MNIISTFMCMNSCNYSKSMNSMVIFDGLLADSNNFHIKITILDLAARKNQETTLEIVGK